MRLRNDSILRCYLENYPIYLTYFSLEQIYLDKIDLINVIKYDLNNWLKKVFTSVWEHGVRGKEKNAVKIVNSKKYFYLHPLFLSESTMLNPFLRDTFASFMTQTQT